MTKQKNKSSRISYSNKGRSVTVIGFEEILRAASISAVSLWLLIAVSQNAENIGELTAMAEVLSKFWR